MGEYTGPQNPVYSGTVALKCNFLHAIQARAHELMADRSFFVPHMVNLVKDVIRENGGVNVDEYNFTDEVIAMLNSSKVNIILADCAGNYAEANAEAQEIHFNKQWMVYVEDLEETTNQYKKSFALAVIKYIHEYAHTLTPEILRIDKTFRRSSVPKRNTPMKIGTKKEIARSGKRVEEFWLGDMGFRLEEIISGARIFGDFEEPNSPTKWEIMQLIAMKLKYDPGHESNLRYAKFINYSIKTGIATAFKNQLFKGERNKLFLNESSLVPYQPLKETSANKKRKLSHHRNAPLLFPTMDLNLGGDSGGEGSESSSDAAGLINRGIVDYKSSDNKCKA